MKDALLYAAANGGIAARAAIEYAAGLAEACGTEVTAVTFAYDVVQPISLYAPHLDESQTRALRATNMETAEAALAQAAKVFERLPGKFIGVKEECLATSAIDLLLQYARLRDVAILPNASHKPDLEREMIEELLFASGRPVLLVPGEGRAAFGMERVMIAWDGSRTAVRALADALPILTRAKAVHAVTVTDDKELRLGSVDLARHLALHGVEIVIEQITREGGTINDALYRQAGAMNADLLVMGAFGHSRLRDFILGGATRSALGSAPLPILMSH